MKTIEIPATGTFVSMEIGEAHARLRALDARERQHWIVAITIMLALAVALFAFTLPGVADSLLASRALVIAVRGISLLVILFGVIALRRQRLESAVRHQVASELAVIAAAETLKVTLGKSGPEMERRASPRAACDERLDVTTTGEDGVQQYYGRIIDICEHGLGAIIPCVLTPGQEVKLRFALNSDESLAAAGSASQAPQLNLSAIVRQRSGFRYGFSFAAISAEDIEEIESYRVGGQKVVSIARK